MNGICVESVLFKEAQVDLSNGELVFPEDLEAAKRFAELKKKRELEKAEKRKQQSTAKKIPPKSSSLYRPQKPEPSIPKVRESAASGEIDIINRMSAKPVVK